MKYQIPSQLQEKLSVHSESDANAIRDCLAVFHHVANLNADSDNEQGRSFSVNFLHKSNAGFKRKTKSELNVTLDRLKVLGVISESALTATTSGKSKEVRYLSPLWLNGTLDELEAKLFNLLTAAPAVVTPVLESAEVTPLATEVTPLATNANGSDTQTIEIALAAYDWLSDPENTEIDNQNAQVFSIKRISKEIENAAEGLVILERHWVIGVQYREPNARNRMMSRLNQAWFKVGGRMRLVNLLIPPKPEPYKPVGPLRALYTFFFLHQGRSQTIFGGRVIADEQLCRLLLDGAYPVVSLDDFDTCICASTICRHRFKLSDSATLDHPALLVLQDFFFKFNHILIDYKRGDIISRRDFFEFLTKGNADWPVIPAAESEYTICPRCRHASKTTALQAENR